MKKIIQEWVKSEGGLTSFNTRNSKRSPQENLDQLLEVPSSLLKEDN
mgnify:CR=1 FL=1